jgi:DNA-binding transcriptional LysR family regulator
MSTLGAQLVLRVRPLYEQMAEVFRESVAAAQGFDGTLRLTAVGEGLRAPANRCAAAFRRLYPEAEVQVSVLSTDDVLGVLRERRVDVMLAWLPVEEPEVTVGPVVLHSRRVVLVGPGHRLAGRSSVSVEELAGERLFDLPAAAPRYWRAVHAPPVTPQGRELVYERRTGRRNTGRLTALLASGAGALVLPETSVRNSWAAGLMAVPLHDLPSVSAALVWCTAEENARIRGLAECVSAMDSHGRGEGARRADGQHVEVRPVEDRVGRQSAGVLPEQPVVDESG